ncbi:MAG: 5-formyltetrahydrofolate cyclo-ligase [Lachnospiraceae bacterium]|nr:5-formyltetrahydrofolate cyclo-ligase [Lachnospiraceae bacterium]
MKKEAEPEEKKIVRDHMKRMRRNLSADCVMRFGAQISAELLSMDEIRRAKTVFLYSAVRKEANPESFIRALPALGKQMAYPRVCGDEMDFYVVQSTAELTPGAFGIPEPEPAAGLCRPTAGSVILVPGVAFMENGNRIGMGKGYYDRYLARYPALLRIGIAYEAQLSAVWVPDEQDLPMDFIVTENRVIRCQSCERV